MLCNQFGSERHGTKAELRRHVSSLDDLAAGCHYWTNLSDFEFLGYP